MTVMLVKPHLRFKESYNNYINELADEVIYAELS
ncbi:hypothetical protein RFX60_30720, partial [Acinetobacter sp. 11520]|nr:hypothetical protein [Acinetobacter sp. 11520]